jgi:hypothetical protein
MFNLNTLQEQFIKAVSSAENTDPLDTWIAPHPTLSAQVRIQIYRNSILGRLTKVLTATYPVCLSLVGGSCFKGLCRLYIESFSDNFPDVSCFGTQFPDFLRKFQPMQQIPYLPDVALLEWARHFVLCGPRGSQLDIAALAKVPAEQQPDLHFHLAPTSRLIHSDFPILRIWDVNQTAYQDCQVVHLSEGACDVLVHRRDWQVRQDKLTAEEFLLLSCFDSGLNFEQTFEICETHHPSLDMPALFSRVIEQGWLVGFDLSNGALQNNVHTYL